MLRRFEVHRAGSVDEAVALRQRFGDEGAIYAGGTELLLAMKLGVARWPHLIDIKTISGLGEISVSGNILRIGATATHWDLERDPSVARAIPAFTLLEQRVANIRVRAAGTIAGNIAFAEPHADPPAFLAALGAVIVIEGSRGTRRLSIDEFLTGMYQTALGPDELIIAIEIPIPDARLKLAYVKFQILERPSVGVAIVADVRNGLFAAAPVVVVGAVDEVPRRVTTDGLLGADPRDPGAGEALAEAARAAVDPVADLAGSVEYKRHTVGVFARRALAAALGEAA